MQDDMGVTPGLLELIACPACDEHGPVLMQDQSLVCSACKRTYPVINGIPIMLVEESSTKE